MEQWNSSGVSSTQKMKASLILLAVIIAGVSAASKLLLHNTVIRLAFHQENFVFSERTGPTNQAGLNLIKEFEEWYPISILIPNPIVIIYEVFKTRFVNES